MTKLLLAAGLVMAAFSSPLSAQFVKGNEAISSGSPGRPELPPIPRAYPPVCSPGAACPTMLWYMVETSDGLQECTESHARPGSCRPSSYGSRRLSRVWVVKSKGVWLQCQYPELQSKCVPIFGKPPANLPYSAYQ
jgi:hypothetical protein